MRCRLFLGWAEQAFRSLPGVFDTRVISYRCLIKHFWTLHDPTSFDRQDADVESPLPP
jgi:peptide methionine sulfoxide reductase MsrA